MKLVVSVPSYALEYGKANLRKVIRAAGREIAGTARALIRSGNGKKHGPHVASSPGQPPSNRTGKLASSLKVSLARGGEAVRVTDMAGYALALEAGAKGGGGRKGSGNIGREHKRGGAKGTAQTVRKLAPRPFLSIAAQQSWPSLEKRIQDSIEQDIDLIKKA